MPVASEKVLTPIEPVHIQEKTIQATLSRIRHKLFVMSGKGGVGKSSVTVNIAAALAERGFRVGILDVDIHGPSVPNLLGLRLPLQAHGNPPLIRPARFSDRLSVVSMDSLLTNKDTAIIWRGPKKAAAIRRFFFDVDWGELDFLLIDSPPGTGDEHMAVLKTIPDVQCILVTTPQEISLADVRKAIDFLHTTHASILGLVENMSGLACPACGADIPLFKKGGGKKLAETAKLRFLCAIPIDPATVVAADQGTPVVLLKEASPAKDAFTELAQHVSQAVQEARQPGIQR